MKTRLALATIVYTFVFIAWNNQNAAAMKEDTIELNSVYIDQTEKQIPVHEKVPQKSMTELTIGEMDLAKITRAVATAETANGKTGSGRDYNNLCGLMYRDFSDGTHRRHYHKYDTYIDGFNACSKILMTSPSWQEKKYKDMTISEMARQWTGADRETHWIKNVTIAYNNQL